MKPIKLFIPLIVCVGLLSFACGPSAPPEAEMEKAEPAEKPEAAPSAAEEAEEEAVETAKLEPPKKPAPEAPKPKEEDPRPVVVMETSKGNIKIELDREKAPKTVENFLQYVDDGFYDGTIFHRVIPGFMIQGGGFTPEMREKPTRGTIENEAGNGLKNVRGTVAMARRPDPHSASAQFFINHATSPFLDKENARDGWGYAVFGKVIEGMDVVDEIAKVKTGNQGMHRDVPEEPVVIESVRRAS